MLAQVSAESLNHRLQRNTRCVGDAIDDVERTDRRGDVDEAIRREQLEQLLPLALDRVAIPAHDGFGECDETRAVLDSAVRGRVSVDGRSVDLGAGYLAARTEQRRVGAGSIEALVHCRDALGDEFYLHTIERAADGGIGDLFGCQVVRA